MFGFKFFKESEVVKLVEEVSLYRRELEDMNWINLSSGQYDTNQIFSVPFKDMLKKCKTLYYRNPLAGQWVHLTTQFVFGEGISVPKCADEKIQAIVDEFWNDEDNKKALTSFPAQQLLCNKFQVEGNIFFVLFTDEQGRVKVRLFNTEEVDDVISDGEDRMRPIFFKVMIPERKYNFLSHSYSITPKVATYYPSADNFDPTTYGVQENYLKEERVMHFKGNCDINDKFGVPDLYRGLGWIKAHTDMCEDVATLVKALSQFAWKKKVKGSAGQVASIAGALTSRTDLKNIKNSAGQMQVENDGVDLQSIDIKQGGVKVGVDGSRQMKLMVCAASGIFEHYYGDPSTGNLATAKSMELPMVKKFTTLQSMWTDIYKDVLNYVIDRKIEVGELPGREEIDPKAKRRKFITELDRGIDIDFPPILEEDLNQWATAIKTAKDAGLVGEELAAQLFMLAANVNNIDEELKIVMGENEEKKRVSEEQFGMRLAIDQSKSKAQPTDAPVKEAIETPAKKMLLRSVKKENYVQQKMNGYRKSVVNHWRKFLREVRNDIKTSELNGKYVGDVVHFNKSLAEFIENMKEEARTYYPIAIQIGEKFMQANLKDLYPQIKLEETLYEAKGRAKDVLGKRLLWNDRYISSSLEPAIIKKFQETIRDTYDDPAEFRKAVNATLASFEPRIEQYIGAFWTVEQEAVKEAGRGTGVMVNFVGPNDTDTCVGCEEAVTGNPWNINEAPLPGEQDCLGRCRHALQVIEGSDLNESYNVAEDKFSMECNYAQCKCGGKHEA